MERARIPNHRNILMPFYSDKKRLKNCFFEVLVKAKYAIAIDSEKDW